MPGSEHGQFTPGEMSAVLESLEHPAIVIGRRRQILAVNGKYAGTFGRPQGVVGHRCYEVSHGYSIPCDEMGESCPIRSCLASGEPCRVVHVHHTPQGQAHEEITTHPVVGEGGEITAFLEVIRPTPVASARPSRRRMVGRSPAFNHMLELIQRVAQRSTPVLLLGETGTGKELAAQALHDLSDRSHRPFVPVDCSGLSESLFESELFGHERGAFTGAAGRKTGLVEAAAGGTLFLDEVGDIPLPMQVKLLRLLENGVFRRVGSVELVRAEFRLVCATHRDLGRLVEEGGFRKDLYYRINAFPVRLPPLRERDGDLGLLAETMLRQVECKEEKEVAPSTLEVLAGYDFPGNVRELRNLLERACLLCEGDVILPEHLPEECRVSEPRAPRPGPGGEIVPLTEMERRYLTWAVESFPGNHRELARSLGLSERTLYRKLERLRVVKASHRNELLTASPGA